MRLLWSAIPRTSSSDGRLDERDWRDAPVLKPTEQSPKPSGAIPYETEVRIIVSNDRIFFGFVCKDSHPNRLSIHTMRRDEKRSDLPMTARVVWAVLYSA
jgi:hypothetical protein